MTGPADPDAHAHEVYRLLQRSRYAEAVERLPELIRVADAAKRPDLCARAWTWLGHAHLHRNALKDAREALRMASAIATAMDDTAGLTAISELRRAVGVKAMQAPHGQNDQSVLGRACAALDAGHTAEGEALARSALEEARADGEPRAQVLALLALARIPAHTRTSILEAATVADQSNDRNLVTAVAHAARAAGMEIAPKIF